jgi:hypothetical protein
MPALPPNLSNSLLANLFENIRKNSVRYLWFGRSKFFPLRGMTHCHLAMPAISRN